MIYEMKLEGFLKQKKRIMFVNNMQSNTRIIVKKGSNVCVLELKNEWFTEWNWTISEAKKEDYACQKYAKLHQDCCQER